MSLLLIFDLKLKPALAFDQLVLKAGMKNIEIENLKSVSGIYHGEATLEGENFEKGFLITLSGRTLIDNGTVAGEIKLAFNGRDFGSFYIKSPIKNGHFETVICDLSLQKIPQYSFSYISAGTNEDNAFLKYYPQTSTVERSVLDNANLLSKFPPHSSGHLKGYFDLGGMSSYGNLFGTNGGSGNDAGSFRRINNSGSSDIRINNSGSSEKKEDGGVVTVFFGTNRNRVSDKKNKYFGSGLSDLQLGLCLVSVPPGHRQGCLERPGRFLWWQRNENPERHIVLKSIVTVDAADFYSTLKSSIGSTDTKAAMIFVHGFNTTFQEAAWRCGQITYDIPFSGITGFFSWPSAGGATDYARDVERAEASITCLAEFIEQIINETGVEQLHFIGHSMGNRILTRSLNMLMQKGSFKDKISVISQIVLAAPDIDADVFNTEIYPTFKKIGKRRTIYASKKDIALFLSEKLHKNLRRIGEGGENIFVVDGVDTVDASYVLSKGLKHSYVFEESVLLYDLNMLFVNGAEPGKRRLLEKTKKIKDSILKYWLFRK